MIDYVAEGGSSSGTTAAEPEVDPAEALFDAALIVEDPTVAPLYDRRQIVQRPEAPEVLLLTRDLWVVGPSDAVRDALYDRIRRENLFRQVGRTVRGVRDPYLVQTYIDVLEYRCCSGPPVALLDIEMLLVDSEGKVVARTRSATEDEISESVTEFVVTVNRRLSRAIDRFVAEIEAASP
ncbi:MAG: ABC-type transport auxiliary lipoprotein family protein [Spirochaetaceae bacterium]